MTDDLESLVQAGLQRRADRVDTTAPVLPAARSAVRGRRRRRAAAGVFVAAVAVVAVAGFALGRPDGDTEGAAYDDPPTPVDTSGLRTEYWHGVQVDVPSDWGWGSAPGAGGVVCGSQEGTYVGRPVGTTDLCTTNQDGVRPEAPYVWLGADLPPGAEDLGGGWVRETLEVAGTTVSVAARDSTLRDQILGSARPGELCQTRLTRPPAIEESQVDGGQAVRSMRLCAYSGDEESGFDLVYAARLGARAGQDTLRAAFDAPRAVVAKTCDAVTPFRGSYVALRLVRGNEYSSTPVAEDLVVDLDCLRTEVKPDRYHVTTEESVVPWATDGVPATVRAGGGGVVSPPWIYDHFIGPQG